MADIRRTSEYRKLLPFIARASGDVGNDTVGEDVSALLLALDTHKTSGDHDGRYYTETEIANLFSTHSQSDDHDGRYYTETEIDLALALKADKAITLTAGNGLTGGGNLSENRTFNVVAGDGITVYADSVDVLPGLGIDFDSNGAVIVDLTENYAWTGNHSFTQTMYAGSIMPHNSDTYDLGSSASLWRKIWGSELSAVVFAQYEQVLLGGWFTVSKGEGVLPADILSTDTTIDLGASTYEASDVLVFRGVIGSNPQVEYIRVVSLSSGTTYNVTRGFNYSTASDWQKGAVFANYGTAVDGRIELNAYDTPRISVFSHDPDAAELAQKEQVRIGDLINGWGYSASTYGAAFGAYEPGKANITIDSTNGIRIRNYDQTVIQLTGTGASFENVIKLGTYARLEQGTGTWGSTFTGSAIWNESGIMSVGGWQNGVKQWWGGSDGKFYANDGLIRLDHDGLTIIDSAQNENVRISDSGLELSNAGGVMLYPSAIKFVSTLEESTQVLHSYIYGHGSYIHNGITIEASGDSKIATLDARAVSSDSSEVNLKVSLPGSPFPITKGKFQIAYDVNMSPTVYANLDVGLLNVNADNTNISGNLVVDGTIKDGDGVSYVKTNGTVANATNADKVDGYHASSFARLSGASFTGAVNNTSYFNTSTQFQVGGNSNNALRVGNGDGASYTTCNMDLKSWNGIGIIGMAGNPYGDGTRTMYIDARAGILNMKGQLNAASAWITGTMSALTVTDRTPFYEGDALAEIKNIRGVTNSKSGKKEIDHKTLPEFARAKRKNADGVETDERDLGAMISILTTAVQQLTDKIERLENGTQKENKL